MSTPRRLARLCVVAMVLALTGAAVAAPRASGRKGAARGLAAEVVAQLAAELASTDEDAAANAARRLGELGGPGAADALFARLSLGLTPHVTVQVIGSLGKLKDARSLPLLVLYAGNHDAKVRVAAVKALGEIPDPRANETLLERLGDGAAPVRAAAAEALAGRKEKRAAKRLFQLVARNDAGAAGPLGALIAPDEVPRLAELQGRVDDAVIATAFGEFLKRPEVPDRLRLDVVRTVARIPGPAATTALVEYLASVPDAEQRPSREEAQKLVEQRGGKP